MSDNLKDKLVQGCRRARRKVPILKGLFTFCMFFVLLIFHFVYLFTANTKKVVMCSVMVVFYTISCSFCAPMFEIGLQAQQEENWSAQLADEEISLAETQQEAPEVITKGVVAVSEEMDEELRSGEVENYSLEDILEKQAAQAADDAENTDGTSADAPDANDGDDSWKTILVNKQHPIPDGYEFKLGKITGNLQCDARIIPELLEMLQAAKEDRISLIICSPYRPLERQEMLFNRKVSAYMSAGNSYMDAYKLASQAVTIPGSSEHQMGLALDIYTAGHTSLDEGFGDTMAGKWLYEHCSEYGFILRYPKGKEYITGIEYEPWHFRYVGKEAAKEIMAAGICLEEYMEMSGME